MKERKKEKLFSFSPNQREIHFRSIVCLVRRILVSFVVSSLSSKLTPLRPSLQPPSSPLVRPSSRAPLLSGRAHGLPPLSPAQACCFLPLICPSSLPSSPLACLSSPPSSPFVRPSSRPSSPLACPSSLLPPSRLPELASPIARPPELAAFLPSRPPRARCLKSFSFELTVPLPLIRAHSHLSLSYELMCWRFASAKPPSSSPPPFKALSSGLLSRHPAPPQNGHRTSFHPAPSSELVAAVRARSRPLLPSSQPTPPSELAADPSIRARNPPLCPSSQPSSELTTAGRLAATPNRCRLISLPLLFLSLL